MIILISNYRTLIHSTLISLCVSIVLGCVTVFITKNKHKDKSLALTSLSISHFLSPILYAAMALIKSLHYMSMSVSQCYVYLAFYPEKRVQRKPRGKTWKFYCLRATCDLNRSGRNILNFREGEIKKRVTKWSKSWVDRLCN